MEKVILPSNIKRSLSSTLFVIEKLITELETDLNANNRVMLNIITDNKYEQAYFEELFVEIKKQIQYLATKYNLQPVELKLSQIINAKRSQMWEMLSDSKTAKLKGYGEFPPELTAGFDNDIDDLLKLTEKIL